MEQRKLGKLEVSCIGLGTYRTFDVKEPKEVAVRTKVVHNCLDNGINLIDSAWMYGEAEKVIGEAIQGRREQVHLATKVRTQGKEAGIEQIENSFRQFGTDYIDLYQVHNMVDWQTQLDTLDKLKDEGRIGMIGVSAMVHDAYPQIVQLMKDGRIDTVQVPYNVMERACEVQIFPTAEETGTGILIMEPLKKGQYVTGLKSQPDLSPLKEMGIETWAQALISWVLGDSRVSCVIPATSKPERVSENSLPGKIGPMPQELREYVRKETVRCLNG
jgi:aryl-alcohol dehydrogenase-like predicted oxidoreductase